MALTREELRKKAENDKPKKVVKKDKSKDKDTPKAPPKRPEAVLEIKREYVEWFFEFKATSEQRQWIKEKVAELQGEFGDIEYFSKFKMPFAEKFLDDIITDPTVKKSMLETFFDIEDKEDTAKADSGQEEAVGDE
jgi:cobalamin biosynthesis protein CobT